MIDYAEIEKKWQDAWASGKIFEAEPSDKKGMLITAAFPYVNSPQHMGHMRTYGTADVYARYMRMRGYNVLFPMAFHFTGTPILAMAKRVASREKGLIDDFKNFYHIPEQDIEKMGDPLFVANYFSDNIEEGMKRVGLSIDWRRKFNTIDPLFSKFVEWQFGWLKEKGYLVQGTHNVAWCTNENNAVGGHDTRKDAQPEIDSVIVVGFKDSERETFFPCGTYRPETIYGVTNLFVNEKARYVVADIGGKEYYLSKDAAAALGYQLKITVKEEMDASALISRKCVNPLNGEVVPVLPGFFVKPDFGTGIVMSVPAHAPFDYAAVERLRSDGYSDIVKDIKYKKVIGVRKEKGKEGEFEDSVNPALTYLEEEGAGPMASNEILEMATKRIYSDEAHRGVMLEGSYKGRPEPEAREGLKRDLQKEGKAFEIGVLTNEEPVICRCGTKVIVKKVENQWFINYGDAGWKQDVKGMLPGLKVYPQKMRATYEALIDWIDLRATERAQGLGTPFPLDRNKIIESLSDSTLYPAFYTFDNIIRAAGVKPDQLKPEFFNFVVRGEGGAEEVAKSTGIETATLMKCRESFTYWYAFTSRHSGSDLIANHLLMYTFNHVAIMQRQFYPTQIVMNGMVTSGGEKMSKSIGNTIPLLEGVRKYGADPIRMVEISGADMETDAEFNDEAVNSVKGRVEYLAGVIDSMGEMKGSELSQIDYWLYSKLNSKVENATGHMDDLEPRDAYGEIFYNTIAELKWYAERGGDNQMVVRDYMEAVVAMLSPMMPHVAEELWHRMGNKPFASQAHWPTPSESMVNRGAEHIEEVIADTAKDINGAIALTSKIDANRDKKVKGISIIIAQAWKAKAYNALVDGKSMPGAIEAAAEAGASKEDAAKFLAPFAKKLQTLHRLPDTGMDDVYAGFVNAIGYMERRFGAKVAVEREESSKSARASRALADKPSIDITWG